MELEKLNPVNYTSSLISINIYVKLFVLIKEKRNLLRIMYLLHAYVSLTQESGMCPLLKRMFELTNNLFHQSGNRKEPTETVSQCFLRLRTLELRTEKAIIRKWHAISGTIIQYGGPAAR